MLRKMHNGPAGSILRLAAPYGGLLGGWLTAGTAVALNWISQDWSDDRFGVPASHATEDRPAYRLHDTVQPRVSLRARMTPAPNWQLMLSVSVERLSDAASHSPIVPDDDVVGGLGTLTYSF